MREVALDLRMKMMFVTHIVRTSVDRKGLFDQGVRDSCDVVSGGERGSGSMGAFEGGEKMNVSEDVEEPKARRISILSLERASKPPTSRVGSASA